MSLREALTSAMEAQKANEDPEEEVIESAAEEPEAEEQDAALEDSDIEEIEASAEEEPEETVEAEEVEPVEVPSSWKKEYWESFQSADPKLRDYIHERENQFHEGLNQYRERAQMADEWNRTIMPYQKNFQEMGVNPLQAVQQILNTETQLRYGTNEQKINALQNLIAAYGVDLSQTAQQQALTPQDVDRMVEERLHSVQMQSVDVQAQKQLEDFLKEPPEHFETVRDDMVALLQVGKAESYQDAYDKAIWLNAQLRESLIAKQNSEAEAQRQKEAAKAAKAAKAKASSLKSTSTGAEKTVSGGNDRRSILKAAMQDATNRV